MKNVIFNILTVITLLATVGVGVVYASIVFLTGGPDLSSLSSLSFAPAPELPTAIILPTSTATPRKLPPTWTPTSGIPLYNPNATAKALAESQTPAGTAFATSTQYVIPSITPSPTITVTPSPSRTNSSTPLPTNTPAPTSTPRPTDNLTLTALAQMAIQNSVTAQAMTLQVAQIYQTQTFQAQTQTASAVPGATATALYLTGTASYNQTLAATSSSAAQTMTATYQVLTKTYQALPTNPVEVTVVPVSLQDLSGQWQKESDTVAFTWDPVPGASGYRVYWGTNPSGTTSTAPVASTSYPVSGSLTVPSETTYYLRIRTRFSNGMERPEFTTVYTMRYDNTAPTNPTSASETHGVSNNTWQSEVKSPSFTVSGGSDGGSGIQYFYFWLNEGDTPGAPSGSPTSSTSYSPGELGSDGSYCLWVQSQDLLGNLNSSAKKVFTFKLDMTAPGTPDMGTLSVVPDPAGSGGTSSYDHDTPTFSWTAPVDSGSGIEFYDIYWGTDGGAVLGSGDSVPVTNTTNDPTFHATPMIQGVPYYLRLRAHDKSGNVSDWSSSVYSLIYQP
ncbi:MAG: hypothetical protein LWX83_06040 [Anaerolineae bacterium]|nr:hypothetical protein [Anaerolineae bacterium]